MAYFSWLLHPDRVGHPVLYGALVVTEIFNLFQISMLLWTATRPSRPSSPGRRPGKPGAVDVFIPVYTEPVDVVEPTVRAAASLDGSPVVWLLDDGHRDELAALAARHGVGYLRRSDRQGAKAGNLNRALAVTERPFVAVFDCDHVPHRDFLTRTVPLFDRADVAFVQTPQHYANTGASRIAEAAWAQQAFFFGPIARAKDARGAMFCCGTNVVFSREALGDVGGFPEDSITEDFLLSVRLHERGWTGRYVPRHPRLRARPRGLLVVRRPSSGDGRVGCLAPIPDILRARLPLGLRLQYLWSSSFFLTGWTILVYLLLPLIRITTGAQPLAEQSADEFLIRFAPYFATALGSVAIIGRGMYTFAAYTLLYVSFPVHVAASVSAALGGPGTFVVTPKGRPSQAALGPLRPTLVAFAALLVGIVFGLASSRSPSTLNNVAFLALHAGALGAGLRVAFPAAAASPDWEAETVLDAP